MTEDLRKTIFDRREQCMKDNLDKPWDPRGSHAS